MKNPQTNMMITLPGKQIGRIKAFMLVGDTPEAEVTLCDIVCLQKVVDKNGMKKRESLTSHLPFLNWLCNL